MSSDSLQGVLKKLTQEIEALWTVIGYRADGYRYRRDEVRREIETGALLLSKTKRPVRGTIGVSVATQQKQKDDRELTDEMLKSAMLDSTPSRRRESERERASGRTPALSITAAPRVRLKSFYLPFVEITYVFPTRSGSYLSWSVSRQASLSPPNWF